MKAVFEETRTFKKQDRLFLENKKYPYHIINVADLFNNMEKPSCVMGIKVHFLHSHLDFSGKLGTTSEERSGRFHQDVKVNEKKYQGRWNVRWETTAVNFFADIQALPTRGNVPIVAFWRSEKKMGWEKNYSVLICS